MQQLKQVSRFSSKKVSDGDYIKIDIDSDILDNIFDFTLDFYNPYITKKYYRNLKKLLNILDKSLYDDRPEDLMTIEVLEEILVCYLDKDMHTVSIIAQTIYEEFPHYKKHLKKAFNRIIENHYNETYEISEDLAIYLCKYIEDRLTYYNMFKCKELLMPLFDKLDDSENLSLLNKNYSKIVEKAYADNIKVKMQEQYSMDDFSSSDESSVETILDRTIQEYQRPNNKINTGIQMFNDLLGGGLENGRFYLACGLPKSFKSGLLLNILIWACKYNKYEFIGEDEGKMPTVFYLTMENSTRETINRLYIILTGKDIANYTLKEAKRILDEEFTKKFGVCLEIKYRPNKSINTLDFDSMISDIETDNKKVVLAIQDYTKRIRSSNPDKELRLELANVSDDFCTIAKRRNIPIVSAAQLNRVAMQEVEKLLKDGKRDIGKSLNSSHIGESSGLIENADCSFTIYRERLGYDDDEDDTSNDCLSFHLIATREQSPKVTYFAQKFENGMKLEEDFGLSKKLSITSITDASAGVFDPNEARRMASLKNDGIYDESLDDGYDPNDEDIDFDEEEDDIFKKPKKKKRKAASKKKVRNTKNVKMSSRDEELLDEDSDDFDVEE